MSATRKLSEVVFLDTSLDKRQMSTIFKHTNISRTKISVPSQLQLKATKMNTDSLRPLPGTKPTPVISLNHYIFSGIRTKPSRDDIYKKILIPKDMNKSRFHQRGLIFVWPQKRPSFFYNKELIWLTWFLAHALYWLHVVGILPSGAGTVLLSP